MSLHGDAPIEIADPDPGWPAAFAAARAELLRALAPWVVDIEHIGSTAVLGLAAKPVIDVMVGVRSLRDGAEIVAAVVGLDYEYVPEFEVELPQRRYFRRTSKGVRTHQVHLVERTDTAWWDRHLAFRDWLRSHAADRDIYAGLKRRLAAAHRHDRRAYTDSKSEFIDAAVARALTESARTGSGQVRT